MTFARIATLAALAAVVASCSSPSGPPAIRMVQPDRGAAFIQVVGLPASTLASLAETRGPDQWASILRVAVTADAPPIVGDYRVVDRALRFTPAFPFDPGRPYSVRYDGAAAGDSSGPLAGTLSLPAAPSSAPTTTVAAIYPSGETLPENLLRMYIHFSAPMGLSSGIDHVRLLDEAGVVVEGAFLPLDYEFWDADRQRFTVFFDPGRVKRGILPNRQRGRALTRGGRYTVVVASTWRDANGLPLQADFRKTFVAGGAEMQPLDPSTWTLEATSQSVTVTFPKPLDRGLLARALDVRLDGKTIDGDARVEAGETRWTFTPRRPLAPGRYELVALSILEDPAGNQIGKAFEIDNFDTIDKSPDPTTIGIPFVVGG